MSEELFDEGLNEVEAGLASLQWKASGIDRDRMMYLAGQASVRGPQASRRGGITRWLWPLATAASLLLAVTMGGAMLLGEKPQAVERIVYVPVAPSHDSMGEADPVPPPLPQLAGAPLQTDYLALRHLVLTQGVDAWHVAQERSAPEGDTLRSGDVFRGSFN